MEASRLGCIKTFELLNQREFSKLVRSLGKCYLILQHLKVERKHIGEILQHHVQIESEQTELLQISRGLHRGKFKSGHLFDKVAIKAD